MQNLLNSAVGLILRTGTTNSTGSVTGENLNADLSNPLKLFGVPL